MDADLAGMNRMIGFNHPNQRLFLKGGRHREFAFSALHIDDNGFPHAR
jgi:hypothetical protein